MENDVRISLLVEEVKRLSAEVKKLSEVVFAPEEVIEFLPPGLEVKKKRFESYGGRKRYYHPPYTQNAPTHIRNTFEEHSDNDTVAEFAFEYFDFIDWRQIKSDKGERPWKDWQNITIEMMNTIAPHKNQPVKKYCGVEARKNNGVVTTKFHYINIFNYDYLNQPQTGYQYIKGIMDSVTPACESYYAILKEMYDRKLARNIENKEDLKARYLNND